MYVTIIVGSSKLLSLSHSLSLTLSLSLFLGPSRRTDAEGSWWGWVGIALCVCACVSVCVCMCVGVSDCTLQTALSMSRRIFHIHVWIRDCTFGPYGHIIWSGWDVIISFKFTDMSHLSTVWSWTWSFLLTQLLSLGPALQSRYMQLASLQCIVWSDSKVIPV